MENIENNDNPLSKFADRVRKKLNKQVDVIEKKEKSIKAEYILKNSNIDDEYKDYKKKIISILKKDPNTINPIAQLVDNTYYNKLNEEGKAKYILKIVNIFNDIKENL